MRAVGAEVSPVGVSVLGRVQRARPRGRYRRGCRRGHRRRRLRRGRHGFDRWFGCWWGCGCRGWFGCWWGWGFGRRSHGGQAAGGKGAAGDVGATVAEGGRRMLRKDLGQFFCQLQTASMAGVHIALQSAGCDATEFVGDLGLEDLRGCVGRRQPDESGRRDRVVGQLGDAEVGDEDVVVVGEQQVRRFEVAVVDASLCAERSKRGSTRYGSPRSETPESSTAAMPGASASSCNARIFRSKCFRLCSSDSVGLSSFTAIRLPKEERVATNTVEEPPPPITRPGPSPGMPRSTTAPDYRRACSR